MQSLRRDFLYALAMSVIVAVIALLWGSPFVDSTPVHAQDSVGLHRVLPQNSVKPKPHPGVSSYAVRP